MCIIASLNIYLIAFFVSDIKITSKLLERKETSKRISMRKIMIARFNNHIIEENVHTLISTHTNMGRMIIVQLHT